MTIYGCDPIGDLIKKLSYTIIVIKNQMLTLEVLLFFVISATLFSYYIKPSAAEDQSNIEILDIHTIPSTVYVGDNFTITATVVNNSTNTISFNDACGSPISAVFDKNISTVNSISCFALSLIYLKPNENMTIIGPGSGVLYNATSAGLTNANVTFAYELKGEQVANVTKPFSFTIYQHSTQAVPEFGPIAVLVLAASIISILAVSAKARARLLPQ